MDGLELLSFEIINEMQIARSCYMEAMTEVKKGNYDEAKEHLVEGDDHYNKGHMLHTELLQQEAQGDNSEMNLLLVHAADQLMGTELLKILLLELMDIYTKFDNEGK